MKGAKKARPKKSEPKKNRASESRAEPPPNNLHALLRGALTSGRVRSWI